MSNEFGRQFSSFQWKTNNMIETGSCSMGHEWSSCKACFEEKQVRTLNIQIKTGWTSFSDLCKC